MSPPIRWKNIVFAGKTNRFLAARAEIIRMTLGSARGVTDVIFAASVPALTIG